MNCPQCQTPNAPDAAFCGSCGTRLAGPGTPLAQSASGAPAPGGYEAPPSYGAPAGYPPPGQAPPEGSNWQDQEPPDSGPVTANIRVPAPDTEIGRAHV